MISIIIPTYNYVCVELVTTLHNQLEECGVAYEILVADDCSPLRETVVANRAINHLSHTTLIEERTNYGRAVIRNRLIARCRYDYVLLMDSDAKVCRPTFIADYLAAAGKAPVVIGGLCNVPECPSPAVSLRFRYERAADRKRTVEMRRRNPYRWFTTFNVMVERELLLATGFDSECKEYGHEDTLLGMEFCRRGVEVLHIDNPLIHMGLEPNAVFLDKTEVALRGLHNMSRERRMGVAVSALALRLQGMGLQSVCKYLFRISERMLRRNLLGDTPSLLLFQLYKLGYFMQLG